MKALIPAIAVAILTTAAYAQSGMDGVQMDHGDMMDHADMMTIGMAADAGQATRTIEVSMRATDDSAMIFAPGVIEVAAGETVRFEITNNGLVEHEFLFNTTMEIQAQKVEMMSGDAHWHDTDNAITLDPGESGELAWTFEAAGVFEFACLIPGHYEAGMFGPLVVRQPSL